MRPSWRDLPIPGREFGGIYQAMEYLPPSNRVQEGDLDESPILADRQARRHHRRRRHRRRLPRHRAPSGRGVDPPVRDPAAAARLPRRANPWPTYSNVFRVSSAHEEGGERVYAVNTERFLADADGNVRALVAHQVEIVDGRFEKIEGTDFELPCELVLLAMGFLGPQQEGMLEQLGVELDERSNVKRDGVVHDQRDGCVRVRRHGPRPEPHRVGDRRGPLVRSRRRPLPHGRDPAPRAHPAHRPPPALTSRTVLASETPVYDPLIDAETTGG